MKKKHGFVLTMACMLVCSVCLALNIPGADGSDGILKITTADCTNGVYTIDLGRAATKQWDVKPTRVGCGVYDPEKWAVVFKYSSVQIDEGCTLKFVNHPSNPPVYWLVSGDVTINGEINLDGDRGQDKGDAGVAVCAKPGPGGFAGGLSMTYNCDANYFFYGGGGYGPGGAISQLRRNTSDTPMLTIIHSVTGGGGSYATMGNSNYNRNSSEAGFLYGDDTLIPLIGGSGGAGYNGESFDNTSLAGGGSGGAGGGAICIAAKGTVTLAGNIKARGNRGGGYQGSIGTNFYFQGGCGSGGAVRIVADAIGGSGTIDVSSLGEVNGYTDAGIHDRSIGGVGRIRLDSNNITLCNRDFSGWNVAPSLGNSDSVVLWADAKITMLTLGGAALPSDPTYRQSGLNECVSFATAGERELVFRTENIPTDANVVVKVTPRQSRVTFTGTTVVATMDAGGTFASATWRAMIPLNDARTTFQVLVSTIPLNE